MKLKVIRYNENDNYHECKDEAGNTHRVDFFVDGSIDSVDDGKWTHSSIVGKVIEFDHLHAFISIANLVTKITN